MTESPTQNKPINYQSPQSSTEDEINLIDLLSILVRKEFLIFLNIFIFSLASIIYVQTTTPIFKTEIAFLEPSESFIPKSFLGTSSSKNNDKQKLEKVFYKETSQSLYFKFLTRLQSYKHQKKVFEEGEFLKKFSDKEGNSSHPEDYFLKIHESIFLKEESQIIKNDKIRKFEKPIYYFRIEQT